MNDILNILPIIVTSIATSISIYTGYIAYRKNKVQKEKLKHFLIDSNEFKILQEKLNNSTSITDLELIKDLENVNNLIKKIFDDLTNSNCRTSFKVITYDDNLPVIVTLLSQQDIKSKQAVFIQKDDLFEMTSFHYIFKNRFDYFLENDLTKIYKDYRSPIKFKDSLNDLIYLSTLVVPITNFKKFELKNDNCKIYGFLSIDSNKKNVFDKETHISIAKTFASSLVPFFYKWTYQIAEKDDMYLKGKQNDYLIK